MQSNFGEAEINSLLKKVRLFNRDIGDYEMFAITASFEYAVKLTNGKIFFTIDELQDDQSDALTAEKLAVIAKRFNSGPASEPKATSKLEAKEEAHEQIQKERSFFSLRTISLILGLIIIFVVIIRLVNQSNRDSKYKTYEEKKMTVEEMEKADPQKFLSASGTYRETFFGDSFKLNVVVKNNATVASYKDVVIRVNYFAKSKTVLGTKDYKIYEIFQPHSERTVKLKIENFKDVESIGWNVHTATPM
jgi:hypothetical protein